MEPRPVLGPAFKFSPTEEEIVEYFLKPKMPATGFVQETDVYSVEPWNLGVAFELGQGKNKAFFLTPIHPSSRRGNGRRAKRSAGADYWHGESDETKILDGDGDGGQVVGYKAKNRDGREVAGQPVDHA